ncbi:hypothetical protein Y697_10300 [Mesotoga sp. BH458_6_3_2_1]|nr:hypothetical protein Y697_10300 [Mesotoga sp. BH458_6_3_2_1]
MYHVFKSIREPFPWLNSHESILKKLRGFLNELRVCSPGSKIPRTVAASTAILTEIIKKSSFTNRAPKSKGYPSKILIHSERWIFNRSS